MNDNRNKIRWCDKTVNPIVGCKGPRGEGVCSYCFAERMERRFHRVASFTEPEFFPERLEAIARLRTPSRIFLDSMSDLFGSWVPAQWLEHIFSKVREYDKHTFQALTKNPEILPTLDIPANMWVGVSITAPQDLNRIDHLRQCNATVKFLSIEPLLAALPDLNLDGIDWVIVGAMTGPGAKRFWPHTPWVQSIIDKCRAANVPVFVKHNLKWEHEIMEFPG